MTGSFVDRNSALTRSPSCRRLQSVCYDVRPLRSEAVQQFIIARKAVLVNPNISNSLHKLSDRKFSDVWFAKLSLAFYDCVGVTCLPNYSSKSTD